MLMHACQPDDRLPMDCFACACTIQSVSMRKATYLLCNECLLPAVSCVVWLEDGGDVGWVRVRFLDRWRRSTNEIHTNIWMVNAKVGCWDVWRVDVCFHEWGLMLVLQSRTMYSTYAAVHGLEIYTVDTLKTYSLHISIVYYILHMFNHSHIQYQSLLLCTNYLWRQKLGSMFTGQENPH